MTRQEFEQKYIRIYLDYIGDKTPHRWSLKGLLKQMDVQRYFNDYEDRFHGHDVIWNGKTFEVKTGYRICIERNGKPITSDYVVWTYSDQIGSVTDWRVYKTKDFIEAIDPYVQITWSGYKGYVVKKTRDHSQNKIHRALNEAPYVYLDHFMKEKN